MWKKACFVLLFLSMEYILVSLSIWQFNRADFKQQRWQQWQQATSVAPVPHHLPQQLPGEALFFAVTLRGHWLGAHFFRWDRAFDHVPGAHVVMPLQVGSQVVMVDRGWLSNESWQNLRADQKQSVTVHGVLYKPQIPRWSLFASGDVHAPWPRRIQYLDIAWIEVQLEQALYPYVLVLDKASPGVFKRNWQPCTLSPLRHRMYGYQWALLACVLGIGCCVLLYQRRRGQHVDELL